jgi:hypothetical protein
MAASTSSSRDLRQPEEDSSVDSAELTGEQLIEQSSLDQLDVSNAHVSSEKEDSSGSSDDLQPQGADGENSCPICLQAYGDPNVHGTFIDALRQNMEHDSPVRTEKVSTVCGHHLHAKCLHDNCQAGSSQCPICRGELFGPEDQDLKDRYVLPRENEDEDGLPGRIGIAHVLEIDQREIWSRLPSKYPFLLGSCVFLTTISCYASRYFFSKIIETPKNETRPPIIEYTISGLSYAAMEFPQIILAIIYGPLVRVFYLSKGEIGSCFMVFESSIYNALMGLAIMHACYLYFVSLLNCYTSMSATWIYPTLASIFSAFLLKFVVKRLYPFFLLFASLAPHMFVGLKSESFSGRRMREISLFLFSALPLVIAGLVYQLTIIFAKRWYNVEVALIQRAAIARLLLAGLMGGHMPLHLHAMN